MNKKIEINGKSVVHTLCGPYTATNTFVFPCSKYALPSGCVNTPNLYWIRRSSLARRPSNLKKCKQFIIFSFQKQILNKIQLEN